VVAIEKGGVSRGGESFEEMLKSGDWAEGGS